MVSRREGRRRGEAEAHPDPSSGGGYAEDLQAPVAPGWLDPLPPRASLMAKHLERQSFSRIEVATKWTKALLKAQDAAKDVSADTALGLAYDAWRIAAEAVLATRHIRVRSGQGHHEMVFSTLGALEIAGCEDAIVDSAEIRTARHDSEYGSELASADDVANAFKHLRRYLPILHATLVASDPVLAPQLSEPALRTG